LATNDLNKEFNVDEDLANVPKDHRDRGLAAGAGATAGREVGVLVGEKVARK